MSDIRPLTPSQPSKKMQRFENPNLEREYEISFDSPEFTCLCPLTGQPDFAHIHIHYVPGRYCVELKSLKLYLWSFRNEGAFHEAVTNQICDDLVRLLEPKVLTVKASFLVRGGIHTTVEAKHRRSDKPNKPMSTQPAERGKGIKA